MAERSVRTALSRAREATTKKINTWVGWTLRPRAIELLKARPAVVGARVEQSGFRLQQSPMY
jgi:hypothetical protein